MEASSGERRRSKGCRDARRPRPFSVRMVESGRPAETVREASSIPEAAGPSSSCNPGAAESGRARTNEPATETRPRSPHGELPSGWRTTSEGGPQGTSQHRAPNHLDQHSDEARVGGREMRSSASRAMGACSPPSCASRSSASASAECGAQSPTRPRLRPDAHQPHVTSGAAVAAAAVSPGAGSGHRRVWGAAEASGSGRWPTGSLFLHRRPRRTRQASTRRR